MIATSPRVGGITFEDTVPAHILESSIVSKQSSVSCMNYMKELDRIQEAQVSFTRKLERERQRRSRIAEESDEYKSRVVTLQEKTKGGINYIKEDTFQANKDIAKLEKRLLLGKTRLSMIRAENVTNLKRIDELRRDKLLSLKILNDLEAELVETKRKVEHNHHELSIFNDKNHRLTVDISNIKDQMIIEMEEFSRELETTKENISSTQQAIMGSIRDRVNNSTIDNSLLYLGSQVSPSKEPHYILETDEPKEWSDLQQLLDECKLDSVDALISALQSEEDLAFGLYKEVRSPYHHQFCIEYIYINISPLKLSINSVLTQY